MFSLCSTDQHIITKILSVEPESISQISIVHVHAVSISYRALTGVVFKQLIGENRNIIKDKPERIDKATQGDCSCPPTVRSPNPILLPFHLTNREPQS